MKSNRHEVEGNISNDYTSDSNRKIDVQHCDCNPLNRTNSGKRKPFVYPNISSLPKNNSFINDFGTDEAQFGLRIVKKNSNEIVFISENNEANYMKSERNKYSAAYERKISKTLIESRNFGVSSNSFEHKDKTNSSVTHSSVKSCDIDDVKIYSQLLNEDFLSDTEEVDSSTIFKDIVNNWDKDMISDENENNCGFIPASQLMSDDDVNINLVDSLNNNADNPVVSTPEVQIIHDQQTEFMGQPEPSEEFAFLGENTENTTSPVFKKYHAKQENISSHKNSSSLIAIKFGSDPYDISHGEPPRSHLEPPKINLEPLASTLKMENPTFKPGGILIPNDKVACQSRNLKPCKRGANPIEDDESDDDDTVPNSSNPSGMLSDDSEIKFFHGDHDYGVIGGVSETGTEDDKLVIADLKHVAKKGKYVLDRSTKTNPYSSKTFLSEEIIREQTSLCVTSVYSDKPVDCNTIVDQSSHGIGAMEETVNVDPTNLLSVATSVNKTLSISGFKTAGGKDLSVNVTTTKIASKIFEDVDDNPMDFGNLCISTEQDPPSANKKYVCNNYLRLYDLNTPPKFNYFKDTGVKEAAQYNQNEGEPMSDSSSDDEEVGMENYCPTSLPDLSITTSNIIGGNLGFVRASGKEVKINDSSMRNVKNIFGEESLSELLQVDITEKCDEVTDILSVASYDNIGRLETINNESSEDSLAGLTTELVSNNQLNETNDFIVYNSVDIENAMLLAEENSSKRKAPSEPEPLPDSKRTKNYGSNMNENDWTGRLMTPTEGKTKLIALTSGGPLRRYSYEELINFGIEEEVLNVTAENAADYTFPLKRIKGKVCNASILTGENTLLNLDRNHKVGLYEIIRSFFACPHIESSLLSYAWARNHFRWIVWKLASTERSFPNVYAGKYLTFENVLRQLKYRYKREIEYVQRPILKRIIEMDTSPECRMILCVASIRKVPDTIGEFELELTDGWYSIFTIVDLEMNLLIKKELVKCGTKLITQGAQLIGLTEGCDPLEMEAGVRLKITTNSTRRARWFARLGYCSQSYPLKLGIKTILPCGGRVELLTAHVARIYPVMYMKKVVDRTETFTERAYERLVKIDEDNRLIALECAYTEAKEELEFEIEEFDKQSVKNDKRSNFTLDELRNISSMKKLTDILNSADDRHTIQAVLTEEQLANLEQYRIDKRNVYEEKLKKRVEEKLHSYDLSGKYTRILKIRLVNDEDKMYSATLTIWQPCPELLSLMVEGKDMNFHNLEASGTRNGELQLTMRKLCYCDNSTHSSVKNNYQRTVTTIEEMINPVGPYLFNEIDIVGIIVNIDEKPKLGNRYSIYLADLKQNIVSVTFRWHIKESGYLDVLKVGNIIAAMNLHYLPICDKTESLKNAFVSELTAFTRSPSHKQVNDSLNEFNSHLPLQDRDRFLSECRFKLSSILMKTAPKLFENNGDSRLF